MTNEIKDNTMRIICTDYAYGESRVDIEVCEAGEISSWSEHCHSDKETVALINQLITDAELDGLTAYEVPNQRLRSYRAAV